MLYGFIGTGNMGGALARSCAKAVDPQDILLSNRTPEKAQALADTIGAQVSDNETIAAGCDVIFLGVKPQLMEDTLRPLRRILAKGRAPFVLVSMAAGLTIKTIQHMAGGKYPVIRIMPNTACAVGEGMTLFACSEEVSPAQRQAVLGALSASGLTQEIDEELIDAGSAVAGCGGAFACLFLEGLADGGVLCGLPRDIAQRMAAQMLLGTAQLALKSGEHTGQMKDAICSPGGTTIAGVRKLESMAFRSAAMEAVIAAYERTNALKE